MLLAFRSLFWFVLSLIFSPIFVVIVLERYDENRLLDAVFVLTWIFCWLFLSLAVSENIAKLGNEIVSKILRIAALFAVIGVYYVSIENSLNLQAILARHRHASHRAHRDQHLHVPVPYHAFGV